MAKRDKSENTKNITLTLNKNTDADIIDFLDWSTRNGESVQGTIKQCIRFAMSRICID